jgi:hypothetical protein
LNSTSRPRCPKARRTLRDAGEHVAALPKKEAALPHWQLAAQCLLSAAEHGGIVMMARIAMLRALTHGQERSRQKRHGARRQRNITL